MVIKEKEKLVKKPLLSIVTPAFNEEKNLPLLYARIKKSLSQLKVAWEWIVVDDHSADQTYSTLEKIAKKDKRVRLIRFARNSGSHLALACGLKASRGNAAVCMAADLQDPPEIIAPLFSEWKEGGQTVWAVRSRREGESWGTRFSARLYYFLIRYGVGMKQVPPTGADFFMIDRAVIDVLVKARIRNTSLLLLISSLPFKQNFIHYVKQKRAYGQSGWNLRKKVKLFLDSMTMFSSTPAYGLIGMGIICGMSGFFCFQRAGGKEGWMGLTFFLMWIGLWSIGLGMVLLFRLEMASRDQSAVYVIEKNVN